MTVLQILEPKKPSERDAHIRAREQINKLLDKINDERTAKQAAH